MLTAIVFVACPTSYLCRGAAISARQQPETTSKSSDPPSESKGRPHVTWRSVGLPAARVERLEARAPAAAILVVTMLWLRDTQAAARRRGRDGGCTVRVPPMLPGRGDACVWRMRARVCVKGMHKSTQCHSKDQMDLMLQLANVLHGCHGLAVTSVTSDSIQRA